MITWNGVDVATGDYLIPEVDDQHLVDAVADAERDEELEEAQDARQQRDESNLALPEEINPRQLNQTGWGVLFPEGQDPAIRAALEPLLERREAAARGLYECYDGDQAYRGESASRFLSDRDAPQVLEVDPEIVPYYLLLVGSPEEIPFDFQIKLGLQHAVGRLDLDDVPHYEAYCASLLAHEDDAKPALRTRVVASRNAGDHATELSETLLAGKLVDAIEAAHGEDHVEHALGPDADSAAFRRALSSWDGRPALTLTAAHGAGFAPDDPRQRNEQGAPISSGWGGPGHPVDRADYVTADDVDDATGLIAFNFACFSGGTPQTDSYTLDAQPTTIADRPFVSGLSRGLLARGALAVIGHVDRAYGYSFVGEHLKPQTKAYERCLTKVLDGIPVGFAMESFAKLSGAFGTQLAHERDVIAEFRKQALPAQLLFRWVATIDAGAFTIAGDPAARFGSRDC